MMSIQGVSDFLDVRTSISLRNLSKDFESGGRCVAVKESNVYVESAKLFFVGDKVEIWLCSKGDFPNIRQTGQVVWIKRMFSELFRICVKVDFIIPEDSSATAS